MKITVTEDPTLEKDHIILHCLKRTPTIERLKHYGENMDTLLIGLSDHKQYILKPEDIYYFESVDDQTFAYLKEDVLKCPLRLYELEELLLGRYFVRISKSVLVNLMLVKTIHPLVNRNLSLELKNSEHVICSRRYVPSLKYTLERKNEYEK